MVPTATEQVLKTLVTPGNAIKIANGTGSVASRVSALVSEQVGKVADFSKISGLGGLLGGNNDAGSKPSGLGGALGGALLGKAREALSGGATRSQGAEKPAPVQSEPAPEDDAEPSFGLSNIKSFGFSGPLAFEVGVAQDPAGTESDVTARMEFVDFDWKLTALRPRL